MTKKENNLFDLLAEKPWDPEQIVQDNLHDGKTINLTKAHLGLRGIITVSIIFFFVVYSYLCGQNVASRLAKNA